MEQKGQQVKAEQKRRQILLAMTKVVLQVVPLGLEHVVVFIFDLPASTTRLSNRHHVVRCQAMIGDTAIVVELLTRSGIGDGDLEPIDRQGIVPTAQEDVVKVVYQRHFREAPIPAARFPHGHRVGGLPKRYTLIEGGMGVGFARKDEMATMLYDQLTEGLVAVEVVAQEGDPMGRYRLGMFLQPAFARCSFTVLLGLPVLRHDVLRGQGKDLGLAGADDHGSNGGMIIEGLAIGELTGETVGAMNGFGGKVGGAIEGHQQLVTKDAKMRQHAMLFKALKDLNKHRIQGTWGDGIKQRAD